MPVGSERDLQGPTSSRSSLGAPTLAAARHPTSLSFSGLL